MLRKQSKRSLWILNNRFWWYNNNLTILIPLNPRACVEIRNSQYTTITWCSLCCIHDNCSLSWTLYDRLHATWLTLTISFNGHFHMRFKNELNCGEIKRFQMRSCCLSWFKMHPPTLFYTKLSCLSNDRSVHLNLFDHVRFFGGKIWVFLFT